MVWTGPQVEGARAFVLAMGLRAVSGSLEPIEDMPVGRVGPLFCQATAGRDYTP